MNRVSRRHLTRLPNCLRHAWICQPASHGLRVAHQALASLHVSLIRQGGRRFLTIVHRTYLPVYVCLGVVRAKVLRRPQTMQGTADGDCPSTAVGQASSVCASLTNYCCDEGCDALLLIVTGVYGTLE